MKKKEQGEKDSQSCKKLDNKNKTEDKKMAKGRKKKKR